MKPQFTIKSSSFIRADDHDWPTGWKSFRWVKLERALEVLGEDSGPEFQVLQNSLKKAKAAAQNVPLGVQLEQSLTFVNDRRSGCKSSTKSARRSQVVGGAKNNV